MAIPHFLGRFTVGTSNQNFTLVGGGGGALVITAGTYYTAGYSGEGTSQLVEEVSAQLKTDSATYSASYSATTNRVTLDFGAVPTNVTWDDASVGLLLGFAADLEDSETSYVGTQAPRYTWQPTRGPESYAGEASKFWIPVSTASVQVSPTGATHTVPGYVRYVGWYDFPLLPEADIQAATTTYRDLEQFYLDVIAVAAPVRVLQDRTSYTATSYVTGYIAPRDGDEVGPLDDYRSRWRENYDGLWDVELPVIKRVAA